MSDSDVHVVQRVLGLVGELDMPAALALLADDLLLEFLFDDYAAGLRSVDEPWGLVRQWVHDDAYARLGPAGA